MHDPPRILIVDDHETNRDIFAKRLATQGYELCQATDGEEALDAAKTLLPDPHSARCHDAETHLAAA